MATCSAATRVTDSQSYGRAYGYIARSQCRQKSHCRVSHAVCNRSQFSFVVRECTYKTPQRPAGVT